MHLHMPDAHRARRRAQASPVLSAAFNVPATLLSLSLVLAIAGAAAFSAFMLGYQLRDERVQAAERLRLNFERRLRRSDGSTVELPMTAASYHLFLSHIWGTGQDQMWIVKTRLREMLPEARVFLDVDDLEEISALERYIDDSAAVLVFCSAGYCESRNCMRELCHAVAKGVPLIALLEDAGRGGADEAGFRAQLETADMCRGKWELTADPAGTALGAALFAQPALEWNRLGVFQDVTMRLIAERLLPADVGPTHLPGEAIAELAATPERVEGKEGDERGARDSDRQQMLEQRRAAQGNLLAVLRWGLNMQRAPHDVVPAPLVYTSAHNEGARDLLNELGGVVHTSELDGPRTCCLLYLDGRTWTRGAHSEALTHDVKVAMQKGVPLVLAHEMPGLEQEGRHAVPFASFFACEDGATPASLLKANIYMNHLAVPLKGGPWRPAGLLLLRKAFLAAAADGNKHKAAPADEHEHLKPAAPPQGRAGRGWQTARKAGTLMRLQHSIKEGDVPPLEAPVTVVDTRARRTSMRV